MIWRECISWTGYTSSGAAGFTVVSSVSPMYSSDESINSNFVIFARKRSPSAGMDGRELRSSELYEGSRWSSRAGAKTSNHEFRQLRPKKQSRTPNLLRGSLSNLREKPRQRRGFVYRTFYYSFNYIPKHGVWWVW